MTSAIPLLRFLAQQAVFLGVSSHVFVVGGAVRNTLLGEPIKDIDIVIDSVAAKHDSDWFAKEIARRIPAMTSITTNQYGVAILTVVGSWVLDGEDLKGEVIEIANARKESYNGVGGKGKGYKPTDVVPCTIEEDIQRREFTFNTLMWRLADVFWTKNLKSVEVIDLTRLGLFHLRERCIVTPMDPDRTFSDDPTRMLRAIKFVLRLNATIHPMTVASIVRNADKLADMPWEAVSSILVHQIFKHPKAESVLDLMDSLRLTEVCAKLVSENKAFAAFFGSAAEEFPVHLMLALEKRGFPMKPLGFMNAGQLERFKSKVRALSPEEARNLLTTLRKPPVNNLRVIEHFGLKDRERGILAPAARDLILDGVALDALDAALIEKVALTRGS